MIGITRQSARKAAFNGFLGLSLLGILTLGRVIPAAANYQDGVAAYYRGDFAGAMEAWRPVAEAGDPVAQNSIGALYDHGLGVPEDNYEAGRWYQMAAEGGLALAMRNLANQYATGDGMPYDTEQARQWYEKAAARGDRQSASLLRQLGPATAAASAGAATPTFATPTTAGSVATPVQSAAAPVAAAGATAAAPQPDLVVTGMDSATAAQPAAPATQNYTLDIGGETVNVGGDTQSAATAPAAIPAPAPAPVAAAPTQQAALTTPAPAPRADGNWLIGQWQGPSLGCPKGGGIEFTPKESLSWFDGEVAVRMAATYQMNGDNIVVTSTASDGSSQTYTYQRSSSDRMIIVSIPESMPKSMIGISYRRCGVAPADGAAEASVIEIPAGGQIPATPAASPALSTATGEQVAAAPAAAPIAAVAPTGATEADGWAAFEQGNPQMALAIFKTLAEGGDAKMQVQVAQMYDFGQGVPQDDGEALKWYLQAAESGNAKAQYQAGLLYFRSPHVAQNLVESYRWLSLAAAAGGPTAIPAKSMLNDLERQMPDADLAKAQQLVKSKSTN